SGTDADGTISNYVWSKISGPSSATITTATSATTTITSLVQGVYLFELKVTDNQGATARDTMKVTVNTAANIPPVANAGADKTITLPTSSVSLSGSGTDADGTISNYVWSKISGPSATITTATSAASSITSLVQGVYLFELKVTDNQGATAKDTMQVTVNAAGNIPPVANAGADKTITLPTNSVSVIGTGTDADGTISNYLWSKISGPSATITTATSATTTITSLVQGVYLFELKVTDNQGATAKDTMQVTVNAAGNIPPVANAGADKTITLPTNSVSVIGTGTDADGTISNYLWSKISGPSATITTATSATTTITSLVQGVYLFELKVTDNQGATAKDTMQVTVNAAGNIPPVANAGADKTITLPTNSVSVTGTGTDADGTISSYLWSKISGPSATITTATSVATTITSLVQGVYLFELKVTDNQGATARDTMKVTVNAVANIPPVANAGADKTITLPTNVVPLAGSGGDADGSVVSYSWTKISGPTAYNIVNPASPVTDISMLIQGVYLFELKVTDNKGAIGKDTVKVTVKTIVNIPPIANAGLDQTITLPTDSVTLTGKGMDADGSINKVYWKQISGPSISSVSVADSTITGVKNLIGGTYLFEFSVTDNSGATAKDTLSVTVAVPRLSPVVNRIKIYPNPVIDIATLEINSNKSNTPLLVMITDMQGKIVYQNQFYTTQNTTLNKINMSNLTKGIYAVTVYFSKNEKQTIKVFRSN
ncbi:MAG: T9SS type A sorting domain-containing protein, partial [Ginsengibacter sp.]